MLFHKGSNNLRFHKFFTPTFNFHPPYFTTDKETSQLVINKTVLDLLFTIFFTIFARFIMFTFD
jgi:hypothetical protein